MWRVVVDNPAGRGVATVWRRSASLWVEFARPDCWPQEWSPGAASTARLRPSLLPHLHGSSRLASWFSLKPGPHFTEGTASLLQG